VPATAKADAAKPPRRSPPKTAGTAPTLAAQFPTPTFAAVAAALIYGWQMRHEGHLTLNPAVGYWLGSGGASAMLLLWRYPLRKRRTGPTLLGSVSGWGRIHMMLGAIGPALILLRSNFTLGSRNSNAALLAMLTVAGGGLIGRHLYGRVHLGLRGRGTQIAESQAEIAALSDAIPGKLSMSADVLAAPDRRTPRARSWRSGSIFWLFTLPRPRPRSTSPVPRVRPTGRLNGLSALRPSASAGHGAGDVSIAEPCARSASSAAPGSIRRRSSCLTSACLAGGRSCTCRCLPSSWSSPSAAWLPFIGTDPEHRHNGAHH
jgi:hypothetical protein